jgi:hypothetical protein
VELFVQKKKKNFRGAVILKFNIFVYCGNWRIIEKFQCLSCNYQYRGERNMREEFLSYFGSFFFFFLIFVYCKFYLSYNVENIDSITFLFFCIITFV